MSPRAAVLAPWGPGAGHARGGPGGGPTGRSARGRLLESLLRAGSALLAPHHRSQRRRHLGTAPGSSCAGAGLLRPRAAVPGCRGPGCLLRQPLRALAAVLRVRLECEPAVVCCQQCIIELPHASWGGQVGLHPLAAGAQLHALAVDCVDAECFRGEGPELGYGGRGEPLPPLMRVADRVERAKDSEDILRCWLALCTRPLLAGAGRIECRQVQSQSPAARHVRWLVCIQHLPPGRRPAPPAAAVVSRARATRGWAGGIAAPLHAACWSAAARVP
jgi:hypothetical protein